MMEAGAAGTALTMRRSGSMRRANIELVHRRLLQEAEDDRRDRDSTPMPVLAEVPVSRGAMFSLWEHVALGAWGRPGAR